MLLMRLHITLTYFFVKKFFNCCLTDFYGELKIRTGASFPSYGTAARARSLAEPTGARRMICRRWARAARSLAIDHRRRSDPLRSVRAFHRVIVVLLYICGHCVRCRLLVCAAHERRAQMQCKCSVLTGVREVLSHTFLWRLFSPNDSGEVST